MFKPAKNPQIEELTKLHRKRRINLTNLSSIVIDGTKRCKWCLKPLTGRKYSWCGPECQSMAWAWANPQKEEGLHVLMARQDFKCNVCQFDYMPYVEDTIKYLNKNAGSEEYMMTVKPNSIRTKINSRLMKILKYKAPSDRSPEVDHIIPISKGGTALGFSNHQVICFTCHKNKTKVDLSGKRKKEK